MCGVAIRLERAEDLGATPLRRARVLQTQDAQRPVGRTRPSQVEHPDVSARTCDCLRSLPAPRALRDMPFQPRFDSRSANTAVRAALLGARSGYAFGTDYYLSAPNAPTMRPSVP